MYNLPLVQMPRVQAVTEVTLKLSFRSGDPNVLPVTELRIFELCPYEGEGNKNKRSRWTKIKAKTF